MTPEEHRTRHAELHRALDELTADWIGSTGSLPSKSTVLDLIQWSHAQTLQPDPIPGEGVVEQSVSGEQP